MRPWQFSKPKTPGFGISSSFYLSVLSAKAVMPCLAELINPDGAEGAAIGFGAPLAQGASKDDLRRPMERGAYAIAAKDRKTVLKMLVLSKEEAQFDPEAFVRSDLALGAPDELIHRIRATWTLAQVTFESHHPMVYPALDFLLAVTSRLAFLADGVIADAISRRYLLPENAVQAVRLDPRVDAREHVSVGVRERPDGFHVYTRGMQKFVLPEFEMTGLQEADTVAASRFVLALCQGCLLGDLVRSGERFGAPSLPFEAREGGFDIGFWDGVPVLELLPPTSATASDALTAWEIELHRLGTPSIYGS